LAFSNLEAKKRFFEQILPATTPLQTRLARNSCVTASREAFYKKLCWTGQKFKIPQKLTHHCM
jgi:hypothetical protein